MLERLPHIQESAGLPPGRDPFVAYTIDYSRRINQTVYLKNHTAYLPSDSYLLISLYRIKSLWRYMDYGSRHKEKDNMFYEGRSKFQEDILRANLQETYEPARDAYNLDFRLSTTAIDASNHTNNSDHKQGVDVLGCIGLYALVGFDHAGGDLNLKKRLHIGVQPEYELPVIYLSQKNMMTTHPDGSFNKNFTRYTDDEAKNSVKEFGYYKPFYGLSKTDRIKWRYAYLNKVLEGADHCETQLDKAPKSLLDNLDMGRIKNNLNITRSITSQLIDQIKTSHPNVQLPYFQHNNRGRVLSSV